MPENQRPLCRAEASTYLFEFHGVRRTVGTLAKLAVMGGGPPFRVAGRTPLYTTDDIDTWVVSILSPLVRNTSELAEARLPDERAFRPDGGKSRGVPAIGSRSTRVSAPKSGGDQ